jgi:hypothetical protein
MFPNAKGSERLAVLASIDPSNQAAGVAASAWVALNAHHTLLAMIETGAMANGSTVDAKLQQATDATGTQFSVQGGVDAVVEASVTIEIDGDITEA